MNSILRVPAQESGERIDALLARYGRMSRSAAARLLEEGLVTRNGVQIRKSYRTVAGELYSVALPVPVPAQAAAQNIPLDIAYEDDSLVVINKPKGLVVHPAPGHADGTLVNALLYHCGDSLSGIGGVMRPGIVHRLDKDTSGLLIAAKNDAAHERLAAQLKDRSLSRTYDAIVCGGFRTESGTVNAPIGRDPKNRKKMAVTDRNSRPAVTRWTVIARYPGYTWIRCRLETGRTHQIRVHMAHIGHPLLGDTLYGGKKDKGLETQCLHARGLKFRHPVTSETVEIWTQLPDWFRAVVGKLGPER
jgi:23S rRNA pseudouridine1911/1915/1917 synthase